MRSRLLALCGLFTLGGCTRERLVERSLPTASVSASASAAPPPETLCTTGTWTTQPFPGDSDFRGSLFALRDGRLLTWRGGRRIGVFDLRTNKLVETTKDPSPPLPLDGLGTNDGVDPCVLWELEDRRVLRFCSGRAADLLDAEHVAWRPLATSTTTFHPALQRTADGQILIADVDGQEGRVRVLDVGTLTLAPFAEPIPLHGQPRRAIAVGPGMFVFAERRDNGSTMRELPPAWSGDLALFSANERTSRWIALDAKRGRFVSSNRAEAVLVVGVSSIVQTSVPEWFWVARFDATSDRVQKLGDRGAGFALHFTDQGTVGLRDGSILVFNGRYPEAHCIDSRTGSWRRGKPNHLVEIPTSAVLPDGRVTFLGYDHRGAYGQRRLVLQVFTPGSGAADPVSGGRP